MEKSYAVVGGEGFLGAAIVDKLLLSNPNCLIYSLSLTQRNPTAAPNYRFLRTDITSYESVLTSFTTSQAQYIFHTASPHPRASVEMQHAVNIKGTKNIIEALKVSQRVGIIVYTSSMTVVYDSKDLINVDERIPLVKDSTDNYIASKVEAEGIILEANASNLLTCSLRLAAIIGEGDRQVLPGLIGVLKSHQTCFQIGNNTTLFDLVYVGNAVDAHILAAKKLEQELESSKLSKAELERIKAQKMLELHDRLDGVNLTVTRRTVPTSFLIPRLDSPIPLLRSRFDQFKPKSNSLYTSEDLSLAGQALFITNGEPIPFWSFSRAVWFEYNSHVPAFVLPLPKQIGLLMALISEWIVSTLNLILSFITGKESTIIAPITRIEINYVTNALYFNIERSRRVIGYEPKVGLMEGIQRSVKWFKEDELKASQQKLQQKSKSN